MALPSKTKLRARRREQIVDAAAAIVSELGIENLSLSEIEKRTGFCRGQLTYYFRTKQQILLALYDRVIALMEKCASIEAPDLESCRPDPRRAQERMNQVLDMVLTPNHLVNSHIHALQHTFQAQISHRGEIREKLADLYKQWRECVARDVEVISSGPTSPGDSNQDLVPTPIEIATIYQALLHGLGMQIAADPNCVEQSRLAKICKSMIGELISRWKESGQPVSNPC